MSIPQLLDTHNKLASKHGLNTLSSWRDGHCKLAERVALLRAHRGSSSMKMQEERVRIHRPTPIRNAILRELARVSHYEVIATGKHISKRTAKRYKREELLSVGYPYGVILDRLRVKCPESNSGGVVLRWTATQVRNGAPGFENCKLPQKRPHGMKGFQFYE